MQWTFGRVCFIQGQRQDSVIYHCNDGFFYHKHHDEDRADNPFITLRCCRRKSTRSPCWGAALMSRDASYFECTRHHTHAPDPWHVEEMILRQSVINAVSSGNSQPFSLIIRNVGLSGGFSMEARSRLTLSRMRTAMRDERMRYLPEIPATLYRLAEILSDPQYFNVCATLDGSDSIFAGACGDFGAGTFSVVFMSQRQASHLKQASKVFADGTFKKRPKKPHSIQMFVISCVWYNQQTSSKHIVTCVRVLMQRRTSEAYTALLAYLKTLMPEWAPHTIMADHELAQVRAWMNAFPYAHFTTCLFHFAVDVFRNAKALGLQVQMRQSWVVNTTVKCCAVLPLLPSDHIIYGLHAIGHWARIMGAMHDPLVRDLFTYLHRQWARAVPYLSVYGEEDRTNNISESVHANLEIEVRENGPNVYCLIGAFKRLEDQTMVDLHALQRGRYASRPQQLKTLRNDARIRNLTESYLRNNINVMTFLMEASQSMQAPYNFVFN